MPRGSGLLGHPDGPGQDRLFVIFAASLAYSAGVFAFTAAFIDAIGVPEEIRNQTRSYLENSVFSLPFAVLEATVVVLFELLSMRRMVLVMALVNAGLMFGIDVPFFGEAGPSLMVYTPGMARYTLLASLLPFPIGLALLFSAGGVRARSLPDLPSFSGLRTYLRVSIQSGADITIRNVAYFAMITGAVNSIRVGGNAAATCSSRWWGASYWCQSRSMETSGNLPSWFSFG